MSLFDITTEVEHQIIQLERSRAVMAEVTHYFESIKEWKWLPYYAEHILLLLHVVDNIVYSALPALNRATVEIMEMHKNHSKGVS